MFFQLGTIHCVLWCIRCSRKNSPATPSPPTPIRCANCRFSLHLEKVGQPDLSNKRGSEGDRRLHVRQQHRACSRYSAEHLCPPFGVGVGDGSVLADQGKPVISFAVVVVVLLRIQCRPPEMHLIVTTCSLCLGNAFITSSLFLENATVRDLG